MPTETPIVPPTAALMQIAMAPVLSRALWIVAEQRVADELADGPASVPVVAAKVGLDERALARLLRALASVGVFAETDTPGTFVNTPLSEPLMSDHPLAGRDAVLSTAGPLVWEVLGELLTAAQTGTSAIRVMSGTQLWEYFDAHPEDGARFNRLMSVMHAGEPAAVAAAYDFSAMELIVDLGGGIGTLIGTVLAANPRLRGILVDRPDVVEQAAGELERLGVADRCERRGQDFAHDVPGGADAYLLSHIVHDWDTATIARLLDRCREAMSPAARLLIVETVLPEGNAPHFGKIMDVAMLAMQDGQERTESEYAELLAGSGLRVERVIGTPTAASIVEARTA